MKKILFYGASVTAQAGATGYFDATKKVLFSIGFDAFKVAYGGCHLDDAGFYRFDSVITDDMDYVVFEWNTTGLSIYNELKISYILSILKNKKIKPIFIILPQNATIKVSRNSEKQIYSICARFNIPLLDMRAGLSAEVFSGMVRDVVHTNEAGATYYSNRILDFLQLVFGSENKFWNGFNTFEDLTVEHFKPKVVLSEFYLTEGQVLNLKINSFSKFYSEIIIRHRIGPFSPVISVADGEISKTLSLWDSYCHYEREHFTILINNIDFHSSYLSHPLTFKVSFSENLPKYDTCRREGVDFNVDKMIKIDEFYSLGLDYDIYLS
jgi:hypothetical protein